MARRTLRTALGASLALLAVAAGALAPARAEEPAPAPPAAAPRAPPARKPPTPPPAPRPGVAWEADVEAGLARAARDGRPVLVVVNALEEEAATTMLAERAYPSAAWGDASRPFVCFVGNGNEHGAPAAAGAEASCARFPGIPCAAHRDALSWILRRFSADGESITSPSHLILEPDGAVAYRKEFYTQEESPPFLDAWAAAVAPRLAAKRAWTVREERMAALEKAPVEGLEEAARAWLASGDGYAAPGLVALHEMADGPRKAAIRSALASAPQPAWPALFDDVEAATDDPDADPELALAWTTTALGVDPGLGAWAAARVAARSADETLASKARALLSEGAVVPELGLDPDPSCDDLWSESLRLRSRRWLRLRQQRDDAGDAWKASRRADLAFDLLLMSRSVVEKQRKEILGRAASPHADVRAAAAVALLRVGDRSGVDDLLAALDDLVEGPEVHAALVRWHGSDPGADAGSWEPILRAPAEEPK